MNPSAFTHSTRRQHQFPTLSIQFLTSYILKNPLLPPEYKSTITDCLPHLLKTCERIQASCWVVLSIIVDTLYLRTRGIANVTDRSRLDRFLIRFQTVSPERASEKLLRRLELERRICSSSFENLNKLRTIARLEIDKVKQLQESARFDPQVFGDVKYVNNVVKRALERMGPRHRTAYNKKIVIGSGKHQRRYDAITATKDVGYFAERLRSGCVADERTETMYGRYEGKWNDFSNAVREALGYGVIELEEGGKERVLQEIRKLKEWQGVNEFASWAVTHMAMLNIMGYGKVKSVYRACYDYKVDDRRDWVLPGWVVRYMAAGRKEDWSFRVPGENNGVYLTLEEENGVWYASRIEWEGEGRIIQEGEYEGMMIKLDPEMLESTPQQSVCALQ